MEIQYSEQQKAIIQQYVSARQFDLFNTTNHWRRETLKNVNFMLLIMGEHLSRHDEIQLGTVKKIATAQIGAVGNSLSKLMEIIMARGVFAFDSNLGIFTLPQDLIDKINNPP